jgi:hypothetical protein
VTTNRDELIDRIVKENLPFQRFDFSGFDINQAGSLGRVGIKLSEEKGFYAHSGGLLFK